MIQRRVMRSMIPLSGAEAEGDLGSIREGILFAQQKLLELLLHLSAGDCTLSVTLPAPLRDALLLLTDAILLLFVILFLQLLLFLELLLFFLNSLQLLLELRESQTSPMDLQ